MNRDLPMKKIAFFAAAAALGSGLVMASPSFAQPQIQFGLGPDGRPQVGIRDPERESWERRERWRARREADRERAYEEGRRDATRYGAYDSRCRNITIREENEWGRTVIRRIRRCD